MRPHCSEGRSGCLNGWRRKARGEQRCCAPRHRGRNMRRRTADRVLCQAHSHRFMPRTQKRPCSWEKIAGGSASWLRSNAGTEKIRQPCAAKAWLRGSGLRSDSPGASGRGRKWSGPRKNRDRRIAPGSFHPQRFAIPSGGRSFRSLPDRKSGYAGGFHPCSKRQREALLGSHASGGARAEAPSIKRMSTMRRRATEQSQERNRYSIASANARCRR